MVFAEGVTEVPEFSFRECPALTDIQFPSTLKTIRSYAFNDCLGLTSVSIPESIEEIGGAFQNCSNIKEVTINGGVKGGYAAYLEGAFYNCESLQKVVFGEGAVQVPEYSFINCASLNKIIFSSTLTVIGEYAFKKCTNLKEVDLANIISVGEHAFEDCPDLVFNNATGYVNVKINYYSLDSNGTAKNDSLENYDLTIYNKTNDTAVREFIAKQGMITFLSKQDANSELLMELKKANCEAVEKTVTLNTNSMADVEFDIYERGALVINEAAPVLSQALRAVFYNADGERVYSKSYSDERDRTIYKNLKSGKYTVVILRDNGKMWNVSNISEFDIFGMKKNIDYIAEDINIDKAKTTEISVNSIPELDENAYSMLNRNETDIYYSSENAAPDSNIKIRIQYSIKESAYKNTSDHKICVNMPEDLVLAENSVVLNGKKAEYTVDAKGYRGSEVDIDDTTDDNIGHSNLEISLDEQSGVVYFYVKPKTYREFNVEVAYENSYKSEEMGVITVKTEMLTIEADEVTNSENVRVSGLSIPNSSVELYCDGKLCGTATARKNGTYYYDVQLENTENNKIYTITASIKDNKKTVSTKVQYNSLAPVVEEFLLSFDDGSDKWYDILDCNERGIVPKVHLMHLYPLVFKVKISNDENIGNVRVCGDKDGQKVTFNAQKDGDYYIARGYFNNGDNWIVPSSLHVEYEMNCNTITSENGAEYLLSQIRPDLAEYEKTFEEKDELTYTLRYESKVDSYFEEYTIDKRRQGEVIDITDDELEKMCAIPLEINGEICYALIDKVEIVFPDGKTISSDSRDDENDDEVVPYSSSILYDKRLADCIDTFNDYLSIKGAHESDAPNLNLCYSIITPKAGEKLVKCFFRVSTNDLPICAGIAGQALTAAGYAERLRTVDERYERGSSAWEKERRSCFSGITSSIFCIAFLAFVPYTYVGAALAMLFIPIITDFAFNVFWYIDPSGYVYEVSPDNRLKDVIATVYYKSDTGDPVFWEDAPDIGQENSQLTNIEGRYAWDVPEGLWQVKYEKDGYETLYTDWLPVPPPQTEVNVSMVSNFAAEVEKVWVDADSIVLKFNRPVINETMTENSVTLKDENGGAVKAVVIPKSEIEYNGRSVSSIFTVKPENAAGELKNYTVAISGEVSTYNDVKVAATGDISVDSEGVPTISVSGGDDISVAKAGEKSISVSVKNADELPKMSFTAVSDNKETVLAYVSDTTDNKETTIVLKGVSEGSANVTLTVPEIGISRTIKVNVGAEAAVRFGDADNNGSLTAADSAIVLQKVLRGTYQMPVEEAVADYIFYIDVDCDGKITASDSAVIMQKVLRGTYQMPCELK